MRVALVTTFFGRHRFGGDAAYVERLSDALLRRGHAVTVFYSRSAFEAVRGRTRPLDYGAPAELRIHGLSQGAAHADLLWMHQTGGLGRQGKQLIRELASGSFDVIHFHNISLMGGAALLRHSPRSPVRMMTAHEHWLTCPLSLLWRLGREPCELATCVSCSLRAGRPPQLWRASDAIPRGVSSLDALVFPSHHAMESHARRGVHHPRARVLPYFIPNDWLPAEPPPPPGPNAPFRFVGRLVKEKGLQRVLPLFRDRPHCHLEVVGDGPFLAELRRIADGAANIRFLGSVSANEVRTLLPRTRALLVPSLFPETFGYVLLEAWSQGVPTLASGVGALPEVTAAGGGWICRSADDFAQWIDRLHSDPGTAHERGIEGWRQSRLQFDEETHMQVWESLVEECRSAKVSGNASQSRAPNARTSPPRPHL